MTIWTDTLYRYPYMGRPNKGADRRVHASTTLRPSTYDRIRAAALGGEMTRAEILSAAIEAGLPKVLRRIGRRKPADGGDAAALELASTAAKLSETAGRLLSLAEARDRRRRDSNRPRSASRDAADPGVANFVSPKV